MSHLQISPFTPKKFGMSFLTLHFDNPLEEEFQNQYIEDNFPYLRTAGIIATLIWILSNLAEYLYTPWEAVKPIWVYSLGIVLPILIILISLSLTKKLRKYILTLYEICFIAVAIGMTYENIYIRPHTEFPTEVLHVVLLFAVLTFVRFQFLQSIRVAIIIACLMFIRLFLLGIDASRIQFDFVFCISAFLFGSFASYALEYFSRRNWLLSRRAEKKRQLEIEATNLRTAQELARTIAHEFNNPLGILKMIYELHLEPSIENHQVDKRKDLEKIPKTIERMSDLVAKLLTITEVKSSQYINGVQYLDIKESSSGPDQEVV